MKGLLLLLFSGFVLSAEAQLTDSELRKITEKNLHLLQEAQFEKSKPQPGSGRIGSSDMYKLRQDHMLNYSPNNEAIGRIPNALPEYIIPSLGAMPNMAIKKD